MRSGPAHVGESPEPSSYVAPLGLVTTALVFFALTYRSNSGAYLLGLVLLTVWWIKARPQAPRLPPLLYYVSIGYAAVWLCHALWVVWQSEYPVYETIDGYRHYAELLLFAPMSVAMYYVRVRLIVLLWVPVLAVVIRILHRTDYGDLQGTLFSDALYGFGTYFVTFGMQVMLAALTALALLVVTWPRLQGRAMKIGFLVFFVLSFMLIVQALLTSGSRSAWLCFAVGSLAYLFFARRMFFGVLRLRMAKPVGALALFALVAVVAGSWDNIENRLAQRNDFSLKMLSLDEIDRERDIFPDRRILLAFYGIERWLERPWLGHGPASIESLLDLDETLHVHPHLHNTYVQVLAEGGVVGALACLTLLVALLWGALRHTSASSAPVLWWLGAVLVSTALWSVVNFHLHSSDWRFTWIWSASVAAYLMRKHAAEHVEHIGPDH